MTRMKKIKWMLALCAMMTMVTLGALAEMIPVGMDKPYEIGRCWLMQDGDRIHCLSVSYDWERQSWENQIVHYFMKAECRELRDGGFVPCESHCADRWQMDLMTDLATWDTLRNDDLNGIAHSAEQVTYMIDPYDVVYRWAPDEDDPWRYQCTLDTSLIPYEVRCIDGYYAEDGVLYATYNTTDGNAGIGEGTAIAYSLETGEGEVLVTMPTLQQAYPAGEGKLLIVGNPDRSDWYNDFLYDMVTGKSIPYAESRGLDGLVPDGRGGWYSAAWDALYHVHGDGKLEEVVKLPGSDGTRHVVLSGDKKTAYIYLSSYQGGHMYIYPLESGDEAGDLRLVMAGALGELGWNDDFLPNLEGFYIENPGVEVTTAEYPGTFDEIAVELVTGSDRVDILVVECSSGNVRSLLNKGFYADLSEEDGVKAFAESLYPVWRDACMNGNEIAALPVNARNWRTLTRNRVLWAEENLGPVPATYDELFDAIRDWNARGILDLGYPMVWRGFDSFGVLAYRIVSDYVGKCQREGRPIVFEDEVLLHLLDGLEELRPILNDYDAKNPSGDPLLPEGFLTGLVHISDDDPRLLYDEEVLPLGLTDAQDCVETALLTVLIVNPNSPRAELAKKYLSYLARNPSAWDRCMLMQGMPGGIREPGYENATEQYEQLMPELTKKLEAALREFDDAAGQQLENQIHGLTYNYLYQWEVRPEIAELLYQALPHFTVATADGYGFLKKNGTDLLDMFCNGQMDSMTLVRRLDERMRMMQSEGIE